MSTRDWLTEALRRVERISGRCLSAARLCQRGRRRRAGDLARLHRSVAGEMRNLRGWLTTVASRVSTCCAHDTQGGTSSSTRA